MKRTRTLIVSAQEDFTFPLAEAARKQIFAEAKYQRDTGHEAHILIITPGETSETIMDGINIRLVKKTYVLRLAGYLARFETIQYWGTIGLVALTVALMARGRDTTFTATDGGVLSTGRLAIMRSCLARFFHRFYREFRVFTVHQREVLLALNRKYEHKIVTVRPHLDGHPRLSGGKSPHPCLLYMGHLSRFKGADIVLRVFENLSQEIPDLRLVVADNGLVYDDGCREEVDRLVAKHPDRITLKGKVNPFEEIVHAHLLIHPIRQHCGTFAFSLSLYECLLCRTPFLSSRLEGLTEFFDDQFLCQPDDVEDFTARAREILLDPDRFCRRIETNLARIRKMALECSPC